jgi:hypothetical protein
MKQSWLKVPLCLEKSVTSKGRDGLTEGCADGKPTQIFGSDKSDREMIGLEKSRKNQYKSD